MNTELELFDFSRFVVSGGVHKLGIGHQIKLRFPNNYGASIIQAPFSYGGNDGLFELAVIRWDGSDFHLCYTTPITDDVLGNLSVDDCKEYMSKIMALPSPDAQVLELE